MSLVKNKQVNKKKFFNRANDCTGSYSIHCSRTKKFKNTNPYRYSELYISFNDGTHNTNLYLSIADIEEGRKEDKETLVSLEQLSADLKAAVDWVAKEVELAKETTAKQKALKKTAKKKVKVRATKKV